MSEEQTKIRFIFGLAIIIGATIGGGFWATPLVAGAIAGPISILLTSLVFLVILLALPTYITLSRAWPISPGHYYFPTRLLIPENKTLSRLIGWIPNWAAIFIGGFTVTRYMTSAGAAFLNGLYPALSTDIYTMILITISMAVLWFGIEVAGEVEGVLSGTLLAILAVVVIYGLSQFGSGNTTPLTPVIPNSLRSLPAALAILFSLGAGPLLAIDISGEIEDPDTSVRNVILIGGAANVGFAVLIGLVVFGIVPSAQMEGNTLTTIVQQNFPYIIFLISGVGALIAGVTTNIGYLLLVSRYAHAATDDGILPSWVGKENQYGEPIFFLLLVYASSILSIILDLSLSAIASGFAFILIGQVIIVLLIGVRLPTQYPKMFEIESIKKTTFISPIIVRWTSLIDLVVCTVMFLYLASTQQVTFIWYVGISIAGVIIYFIGISRNSIKEMHPKSWSRD